MGIRPKKKDKEKSLIKSCIKGNRKAQQNLYDLYAPKMFGICLRYARNYHSAEDILQDGFLKVFKYLKNYKGTGSFEGWMRRIFVNVSIEQYRKVSTMYPVVDIADVDLRYDEINVIDELEVKDILNLVNQLADGYRIVFNLFVMEGYTHNEIGKMLGISEGTSKSQLARARSILKKKIGVSHFNKYEAVN